MKVKSVWKKDKTTIPEVAEQGDRSFEYDSSDNDKISKHKNRLDPLTASLGEIGFYHRMRWTWLCVNAGGIRYPLEVSRYYEKNNLAIDLMPAKNEMDDCALKADLCKKFGVRYYVLNDMTEAKKMLQDLGRVH